ncbi:hypothetical protein SanaruYs_04230 [Chryseotalea sanaruensis]|uniref:PKD domain-containing protein n=1 Tax=Chryseotalea sanaruensis TaxID=2482724 RepID=A0A401U5K3_9BACT|nr:PKD-like domain-containing protein [Chryseotalea sanaruensis]GCC50208.1 hypothetical protein SanaruYs_04230 [Chryseotalea sanaruensis]
MRLLYNALLVVLLTIGLYSSAYSQAVPTPIAPRTYSIFHETDNQQVITITWNSNVTITGAAGWTITVGGVPVVPSGSVSAGTTTNIILSSAILPGQAVTVQWSGGNGADPFGPSASQNNKRILCTDFTFAALNGNTPPCAPVDPNNQMVFKVNPAARNSSFWDLSRVTGRVTWINEFAAPFSVLGATETNLSGTALANGGFVAFDSESVPLAASSQPGDYIYPANDPVCGYTSNWYVRLTYPVAQGETTNCPRTSPNQTIVYASHNNDDSGVGGDVRMPATIANSDLVCLGTNVNMTFTDNTDLNCNPTTTPIPTNNGRRWVRVVYGSTDLGGGNTAADNIPNIHVDGVEVTDANGNLLFPGGYIPSAYPFAGVPDAFGVVEIPATVDLPRGILNLITTTSPTGQAVGQRFWVRLDYWNGCNAYDGIGDALNLRRSVENEIEIIGKPVALTTTGLSTCYDATNNLTGINFTTTSTLGGLRTGVNWYASLANVGTTTKIPNGVNNLSLPASAYTTANGTSVNFRTDNTGGRYYSVWTTQVQGATNTCESDPVEVVIYQQPRISVAPDLPTTPVGDNSVCIDAVEIYTTSAPGTKTIAATNSTNGAAINFQLENLWSDGFGADVSVSPTATTTNSTTATFSFGAQPNPSVTNNISVRRRYRATVADAVSVISPLPAPFTLPTYLITPQTCQTNAVNLSVTVFGESNGGTINGSPTICDGVSTGNMTLTGQRGAVLQWERSYDDFGAAPATPFIAIVGTTGLTTYSEVPPNGPGTYKYRVLVQNQNASGPCAAAYTIVANQNTVTVNPVPPKPTITPSGITTFCVGSNVTLSSSTNDADSYQWFRNGVSVVGATGQNIVLSTVAQSGDYTVQTRGIAPTVCLSTISDPVTVTINPLPTASNPVGGGSVCNGTAAPDIEWTLSGTPPFDFTITRSVEGPLVVSGHGSTTYTIVAPNPASSQTYQITSLTDANGCSATALGTAATVNVIATPPPSVELFTGTAAVCDDGGTTNPPDALLDLLPNQVETYSIRYRLRNLLTSVDGPIIHIPSIASDVNGVITISPTYAQMGGVPLEDGYQVIITEIFNTTTLCAGAVPIFGPTLIVNERPVAPTSNGNVIACSDVVATTAISVVAPGAGFEIDWYANASGGGALLSNNNSFTPGAAGTYHAEMRNATTGCVSSSRTAVELISDARPTDPTVGGNFDTCSDAAVLSGSVPDNGGTGTWTVGSAIYNQTFSSAENNIGLNGTTVGSPATLVRPDWTLTVDPSLYSATDANDYFKVTGGVFSGQDLNDGTMTWESRAIDITAFSNVKVSVRLAEFGAQGGADFIRATYTIDGGAPQLIGEIVDDATDGVFQNFSVTTAPAGTTLKIYVSVHNNGNSDHHDFDDVQVFATTTTAVPVIADVNNPASAVTNLQDGPNVFTWTVNSVLGACTVPPAVLTITKNPQPITQDINFDLCETTEGTLDHLNYDLTVHNLAVADGDLTDRAVTWFTNALLTIAVPDATDVTVSDGDVFYARVENTVTGCTNVTPILNPGSVTFNVNPLPVANDQDDTNTETVYCEEFPVGSGVANNIDLTILNDNVIGGVVPNRTVAWFEADGTTPVLTPTDVDAVTDGRIYVARVTNTLTNCINTAQVEITVNPLPLDNAIITPSGTTPATFTVCASTTILLFQVSPTLNSGSTYSWSIPTAAGEFEQFGGGGVNDFFVLLRFPNAVPGGLPITVTETSADGCVGNVNTLTIIVDSAPAAPVIVGDNNVCATENNVSYTIAAPGISTYTWTVPGTLGSIVSGQGTDEIIVNISNTSGNITVIETNATGCVSPAAAPFNVTVNARPTITSLNTVDICSGEVVNANHTITAVPALGTVFDWVVTAKVGPVGGASVGNSGTGQINQTLTNTSASLGQIIYDITPKIDIDPTAGVEFCNGPTQTFTVNVYPEPVGNDQALNICSDNLFTYDLQVTNIDGLGNGLPTVFEYLVTSSNSGAVPAEPNRVAATNLPISHTYTNTTTANVTITYIVFPFYDDPQACAGEDFTITLTVQPEPQGIDDADIVCGSAAVGYDLVANIAAGNNLTAGTTFSWVAADNPDVTGESLVPQTGNTITDVITNVTTGNEDVVYTVTPISASGCSGNTFTVTITVRPTPVGANNSIVRCSDENVGIILSTNPAAVAAATYTIAVNANGLTLSGGVDSNGPLKLANEINDDAWLNNTLNPVNVVYTITPVSADGCPGVSFTLTVQVNPEPIGIGNAVTRCSGEAAAVNLTSNVAAVAAATYNISVNANGLILESGTDSNGNGKASNELADDFWRNTGLSPVNVVYTVIPVSAVGCLGNAVVVTVTVNPEPAGVDSGSSFCSDDALGINISTSGTSVAAATYNIVVNPNGLIQSSGTGSGGNNKLANELAADAWRNIGLLPVDVEYTITPVSADGCAGDNFVITATINPEPVGNTSAATVCSDSPVGVTITTAGTSVAAATYNISVNANGLILSAGTDSNGNGKAANEIADDQWTNTGLSPVNVVYTIIPVSAAPESCLGDQFTITVTINPEPVGVVAAATRCSDQAVGLNITSNAGSVPATSYNIVVNNNGLTLSDGTNSNGINRAASEIADDEWTNTGLLPVNVVYTINPVTAAGCIGDAFTITITINPEPVVNNVVDTKCSDEVLGITLSGVGTSVAADNYTIAVANNGLIQSGGTASAGALKAANELADDIWRNTGLLPVDVVYTITPVSADGCSGNSFTVTVTINPEPVGANSAVTVCSDNAVATNLTTSGFAVAASSYNIVVTDNGLTLASGTPSGGNAKAANEIADDVWHNESNGAVNVIYTVTPISADGCEGNPFTVTVTVNPEPVLAAGLNDTVCSDAIVDLVLNTNGASVSASGYNILNRTVAGGLTPVAQVTVPTNGVAANYLRNEVYRNTTNGALTVTYRVEPVSSIGACLGNFQDIIITINPEPVVAATLNNNACSDSPINLILSVGPGSVPAVDYNLVNRIVAPGLIPVVQQPITNNVAANYLQTEVYRNTTNAALTVQYIVEATGSIGACVGDQRTITITIDPEPVIATTLDANRCSDATIGLVLNTNGTSIGALDYNIVSRVVAPGLTPVAQAAVPANAVSATHLQSEIYRNETAGPLTVTYVVEARGTIGNCLGDQRTITITIDPEPIVSSTLSAARCSDSIVNLILDTQAGSVAAVNYNIVSRTVPVGLTVVSQAIVPANAVSTTYLQNEIYRNTTNGSITVQYVVEAVSSINGCLSNPRTINISIDPEPVISTTLDNTVCSDANVGLVLNTNPGSVLAASYNIVSRTVAAGLTPLNQVVVPANAVGDNYLQAELYNNVTNGPLTVQYVVEATGTINGCPGDQRTITITVNPEPVISPSLNSNVCSDNAIGLILNTNGSSVTALNYNIAGRVVGAGLTPVTQVIVPALGVSSNYLQTERYINTTGAPITVTYTVNAIGTVNSCPGNDRIITITIDPEPVVATTLDDDICSDQPINLVLNTNGTSIGASSYNILSRSVGAGLTGVSQVLVPAAAVSDTYLQNEIYRNTTNASIDVVYVVEARGTINNCLGKTRTITITIDPEPVVSATLNDNTCSGEDVGLILNTNGISIGAASYNIVSRTMAGGLTPISQVVVPFTGVVNNYLETEAYENTTNSALTVEYVVEATGTINGCVGDQRTIVITVDPQPVISPTLNASVCSDTPVNLVLNTNGTSVNALNYNVLSRNVGAGLIPVNQVAVANGVSATHLQSEQYINRTNASIPVTYEIQARGSINGCLGDPVFITITIDPEPVIATTLDEDVCSDNVVGLILTTNGTSISAANYNFSNKIVAGGLTPVAQVLIPANGVAANYVENEVYNNTTNGPLTVQYFVTPVGTINACLGQSKTIIITVNPEPVLSTTLDDAICSDEEINLVLNTNGTSIAALNYNVISRTVGGGLTPIAEVGAPALGVSTTYFQDDIYQNTGALSASVVYVVEAVGTIDNCLSNPRTITLTINPEPVMSPTLDIAGICSDLPTNLTLNTNGTSVAASEYNIVGISVPGGLTANAANTIVPSNNELDNYLQNHRFNNTGSTDLVVEYNVIPVSAAGCFGNALTIDVTINPEPVVDTNLDEIQCSDIAYGNLLITNGTSIGAATFDVTALVEAGLTGAASTGLAQPANLIQNDAFTNLTATQLKVTYSVIPNGTNGCIGEARAIEFKVNPEPVLDVPAPDAICSNNTNQPDQTEIVLSTNGTSVNATNYRLLNVEYSDGGPFSTIAPAGLSPNPSNRSISAVSGVNLVRADRYNNISLNAITVRYTVEPIGPTVGAFTCLGDSDIIEVVVNPEPEIDPSISPTAVCSDVPAGISAELGESPSSIAIATYIIKAINFPDLTAGTSNTGIGNNKPFNALVNDSYTNVSEVQRAATYTIAPVSAAGCTGLDDQIVLTIDPAPNLADNLSRIVCNDATASITLAVSTTVDANGGFDILDIDTNGGQNSLTPNGGNAVVVNGSPANILAGDRFVNTSGATDTVRYGIKPVSAAGCKGPREVVTLIVEPQIQMNVGSDIEICSNGSTNFTLTSPTVASAGSITFNYSASSTSPQLSGFSVFQNSLPNNHTINDLLTNNANAAHTVTYNVTPRAESAANGVGCAGTLSQFLARVQPKPKLVPVPASFTICEGEPLGVDLSTASSPTNGTAVPIPVSFNLLRVEEESGNIPDSVLGFTSVWPTAFNPGIDVLNEVLTNIDTVQRTIRYFFEPRFDIVAGTCLGDETSILVTVNPRAQVVGLTDVEVCSGEEFTQNIAVTGAETASTLITWTRTTPPPTGLTGSSNGAGNIITQVLFNNNNSNASITYTFTPQSFNCVGTAASFVTTILPTPKIVGLASSFNICNDADFEINLDNFSPTTNAIFNWTVDNTDPLLLGSVGGNGLAIDDTWSNATGSLATATYTITPIVEKTDGSDCIGPEKIVSLNVAPEVGATLFSSTGDNDDYLCEGSKGFLFFENTGLPSFDMTYRVDDGTSSNDITLTKQGIIKLLEVQPAVTTTYTILSVKDAFGCEFNPTSDNVVVVNVGDTDANFSIVGDPVNCSPFPVDFEYNQQSGVVYNWKWFDGEPDSTYTAGTDVTDQIVRHTFFNPAPGATVKYKVFLETAFADAADPDDNYPGACFNTTFREVQVYPTVATAVFPDKTEICSGDEVRFVNTSQGVREDKWFYRVQGSGGELESRTGSYTPPQRPATSQIYNLENITSTDPIIIEVVYQAANLNCPAADVVIPITVYRGVVANFETSTPTEFVGGHSFVDVTNTSTPIDATDFTYEWNFGIDAAPADLNGTTPPNPIDYTTPGLKEISLLVTNIDALANGLVCSSEIRKTIEIVVPPLLANFRAIPLAACYPVDITVVENLATGDEFEWTVIDEAGRISATSNANLPVFAIPNPGKYTIILVTTNSFTGQQSPPSVRDIEIFESPVASFEVRPTTVFIPDQEITTFNFSSGANQYDWDFGDGNTSIDFEPKITYRIEGEYPITLVAGFNNGSRDIDGDGISDGSIVCYDTLTRTVQARDGGLTRIPNSFTPNPNGPGGSGGNGGAGSFNDVFLPITKGVEEFMMQIFDRWGSLVFESRDKNQGWDGYDRNRNLLPAGVYVYKLELRLSNGDRTTQVGDITLIR